ncbi:hypothetical protein M758_4G248200 [Ceratodon purpureus]|nr:hypothetical protein M758_4G248200 [Ceratodon purpureus]
MARKSKKMVEGSKKVVEVSKERSERSKERARGSNEEVDEFRGTEEGSKEKKKVSTRVEIPEPLAMDFQYRPLSMRPIHRTVSDLHQRLDKNLKDMKRKKSDKVHDVDQYYNLKKKKKEGAKMDKASFSGKRRRVAKAVEDMVGSPVASPER